MLDNNDVPVTAGVVVIPEFSTMVLLLLLVALTGIIAYKRRHLP